MTSGGGCNAPVVAVFLLCYQMWVWSVMLEETLELFECVCWCSFARERRRRVWGFAQTLQGLNSHNCLCL